MMWTPERKITEMAKDDEECKLCAVIFRGLCNVPDSGLEHNSESVSVFNNNVMRFILFKCQKRIQCRSHLINISSLANNKKQKNVVYPKTNLVIFNR